MPGHRDLARFHDDRGRALGEEVEVGLGRAEGFVAADVDVRTRGHLGQLMDDIAHEVVGALLMDADAGVADAPAQVRLAGDGQRLAEPRGIRDEVVVQHRRLDELGVGHTDRVGVTRQVDLGITIM